MLIFIGSIFLLIGLGIFANGIFSVFKLRRELAGSAQATGTVTGFGREMGKSGYLYCPQVAFADPTGRKIEFQSKIGTQPPAYSVGQQVKVVYQSHNAQQAEIDSLMSLWFVPVCLLIMSLGFGVLGLMLFGIGVLVALNS